jgi:hypothetical protein
VGKKSRRDDEMNFLSVVALPPHFCLALVFYRIQY